MMTAILPDTDIPIKTLTSDQLGEVSSEVETDPASGSLVIQIGLNGRYSMRIIADQSDQADQLLERLTAARLVLELLQRIFTVEHSSRIQ